MVLARRVILWNCGIFKAKVSQCKPKYLRIVQVCSVNSTPADSLWAYWAMVSCSLRLAMIIIQMVVALGERMFA